MVVVQKYGGTSVADVERIRSVAGRIARTRAAGHGVVVVVSAMAGETNRLLGLARAVAHAPDERESDALVATGEQVTAALTALALHAAGVPARSFLGHQVRIETDSAHGRARIVRVDVERLRAALAEGAIAVVAGFQGVDGQGNITTLGRGGSDTSAVALAAALQADVCEIYTDVEGVYTSDPRIVPQARKLERIAYDEMLELASLGAKVLQIRSVEFAKRYRVPVHVRSSFGEAEGTWVVEEDPAMEEVSVAGVAYDRDEAKLTVLRVPDRPGVAARLFGPIARANIIVDMIIQNASADGTTDLTFTVARGDYAKARALVEATAREIGAQGVAGQLDVAKVSIVGIGMRTHAGIASRMFDVLSKEGINIQMISTSEIKISVVIDAKYTELAVRALRDGTQAEDISFTLEDKLRIAERLDDLGVQYIEGGWPGSNPRDEEFFRAVKRLALKHAKVAAFGSTRRAGVKAADDRNLSLCLLAETPVVTIVGKTWDLHVREDLRIPLAENLEVIHDSVAYLRQRTDEVVFDAEHFFDGLAADRDYALACVRAAADAGATLICLCDTRGGSLPAAIGAGVDAARAAVPTPLGIHCHNDCELAVANSVEGIAHGCVQVQGTING